MKVFLHTMYYLPDYGSAPVLMDELAAHLAAAGHEVEVVTTLPRERGPEFRGLFYSRRHDGRFAVRRFWTAASPSPLGRLLAWNVYTAGAILNLFAVRKGDVLFLRTPPLQLGVPAFWAKALGRARIVVNVQDIHPDLAIESGILRNPPTSPGRRAMVGSTFEEITKKRPEKSLLVSLKKNAGRNNQGKVTVRHRGGGSRRKLRIIDFKRDKVGVAAEVLGIEYDPNRSAYIALLQYPEGEKRYILAPLGLRVGQSVMSGPDAEMRVGNALPIGRIPVGAMIHNIELQPGKGAQIVRSAGSYCADCRARG